MFLLILAAFSVMFFLVTKYYKKSQQYNFPPGPKGLPIIGNLHQYAFSNTHRYLSNVGKNYDSIFMLKMMNQSMVVIQSAKLAKEVLKTQDKNFCSRPFTTGRQRLTYNGLDIAFSPYSEYMIEMKKLISANLLSKKTPSYSLIRQEEVSRLIEKVSTLSSSSQLINLSHLFLSYASSNAGRITFGKRYDDDDVMGSRYYSLLGEVEEMFTAFFYNDYFPVIGSWLDMLTGRSSKLEKVFKDLDNLFQRIIDDHICSDKLKSDQEDIVDIMLRLMNDNSFAFKLTFNHVKGILTDLFVGGANTSTVGAIWVIVELIRNPIAMKKVQEEVRDVAQNKGFVQESDLSKLEYFKAVLKETLRLHPPAPLLVPRETIHKSVLKGYTILPKTVVIINEWSVGRDPEHWIDPEVFIPERFLDRKNQIDTDAMFPFGGGRRMCPGFTFGLANLELALANLLYTFDWELPPGMNKEEIDNSVHPGIVTHKKDHLFLVAKKFK